MREFVIFIIIFFVVFAVALLIFNGRFVYAQIKYSVLGPPPLGSQMFPDSPDQDLSLTLIIPKIGVEAPIILTSALDEGTIQLELEKGVVRYPNSNVILGHSSAYPWYKGNYGSVFSLLNKLEGGDELFIFSGNNKYTYRVIDKKIDLPKNLELEFGDSIIYLVSCWPISTAWKRIAVKTERVSVEKLDK